MESGSSGRCIQELENVLSFCLIINYINYKTLGHIYLDLFLDLIPIRNTFCVYSC